MFHLRSDFAALFAGVHASYHYIHKKSASLLFALAYMRNYFRNNCSNSIAPSFSQPFLL
jgi:hypothetical protein